MEHKAIDINCDVGEGVAHEDLLFPHISSCSIACGGHTGNTDSIKAAALLAKKHMVKIGAHPSYPDTINFGRKVIDITDQELQDSVSAQLDEFTRVIVEEGLLMNHIKPHGALYNQIAKNKRLAVVFLEAIEAYRAEAMLYAPFGSQVAEEANRRGFRIKYEAFGDRNYNDDLSLVSRTQSNALIESPEVVAEHLYRMIAEKHVKTISGKKVALRANTFCIHGDTSSALEILTYLTHEFPQRGIYLDK